MRHVGSLYAPLMPADEKPRRLVRSCRRQRSRLHLRPCLVQRILVKTTGNVKCHNCTMFLRLVGHFIRGAVLPPEVRKIPTYSMGTTKQPVKYFGAEIEISRLSQV